MIVISLSNVPPKLRGFLTKYLWEISTGVYVGNVNARIRESLWERVTKNSTEISKAIMVFPSDNEQGFDFYEYGSSWKAIDYEGLKLIMRPNEDSSYSKKNALTESYVVLDLETTGLDPEHDNILEIGAVRFEKGVETNKLDIIVKTQVPDNITELTGITQEMSDKGIDVKEALEKLNSFISQDTVIGFNIRMFDLKFLKKECSRNQVTLPLKKIIDVLELSRRAFPKLKSYKLRDIAKEKSIVIEDGRHRAIIDCIICNEVYKLCN